MSNSISYQTIHSNQIYLNSSLADVQYNGASKSTVSFFFKDVLKLKKNTLEMRVSVTNAEFPVSWYVINDSNNSISITVNSVATNYLFPKGNYNVTTFISQWISFFGSSWALTYDKYQNIFTWSNTNGQFTFSDNKGTNSLFPVIGFIQGNSYTSSGNTLTAIYPFNFYNITRLNIKSNTFNLGNVDSNNKSQTRTICSVPVNATSGGMIYYNNYSHYKSIFKKDHLQNINIEIQDDFKNYINFNNLDWTITLQIDLVNEVVEDLDTLEDIYNNNL